MPNGNSKPWRLAALRANVHLGTARMLLDLAIEESRVPPETAAHLRSAQAETIAAQDLVREIAGGAQ
jgi:hypothetical protein